MTFIIDALERRDVATTYIPGAFMQSDMDEVVNMKIEGKIAQLMTKSTQRNMISIQSWKKENQ